MGRVIHRKRWRDEDRVRSREKWREAEIELEKYIDGKIKMEIERDRNRE